MYHRGWDFFLTKPTVPPCVKSEVHFEHTHIFPRSSAKRTSARSDWCWCKLQIFCQCSLWPCCPYSQPAQQPPRGFGPNLITCFICTSLYFNQGWLYQQWSSAWTYCSCALTRISMSGCWHWIMCHASIPLMCSSFWGKLCPISNYS